MNLTYIRQRARKAIADAGVIGIYPVPLEEIAMTEGFTVKVFDKLENDIAAAINYDDNTIYVSDGEVPVRQRFSLAHELGHAFLHKDAGNIIDYRKNLFAPGEVQDPKEREANKFAAYLLMPEEDFRSVWLSRNGNVKRVADYFGVSAAAAQIHAQDLRL